MAEQRETRATPAHRAGHRITGAAACPRTGETQQAFALQRGEVVKGDTVPNAAMRGQGPDEVPRRRRARPGDLDAHRRRAPARLARPA